MSDERKWHVKKAVLIYGGFTIFIVVHFLGSIMFKPGLFLYLSFFVLLAALIMVSAGILQNPKRFTNKSIMYTSWMATGIGLCMVVIRWDHILDNEVITVAHSLLMPVWVLILALNSTYRHVKSRSQVPSKNNN